MVLSSLMASKAISALNFDKYFLFLLIYYAPFQNEYYHLSSFRGTSIDFTLPAHIADEVGFDAPLSFQSC